MFNHRLTDKRFRDSNKCYTCEKRLKEGVYVSCSSECIRKYNKMMQIERIAKAEEVGNTMFFARKKMKALRFKCKKKNIELGICEMYVSNNREKLKDGIYRKDVTKGFIPDNIKL